MSARDVPTLERAVANLERMPLSPAEKAAVAGAVRTMFKQARDALSACGKNAGCYVKLLVRSRREIRGCAPA